MNLVDMTNPERPVEAVPTAGPVHDKFPWGLRITLNGPSLEKLGLKASDFNVKMTGTLTGKFKVVSVRQNETETVGKIGLSDTTSDESVELQITEMGIDGMKARPEGKFRQMMKDFMRGPGE